MSEEKAIAVCAAIKVKYNQTAKGEFITFMINRAPDNSVEELVNLELGEVIRLYVTKPDEGL